MALFGLSSKIQKPGVIVFLKNFVSNLDEFLKATKAILNKKFNISEKIKKVKEKAFSIYKFLKSINKDETDKESVVTELTKNIGKKTSGRLGKIKDWFIRKSQIDEASEETEKESIFSKLSGLFKKKEPEEISRVKLKRNNKKL